MKILLSTRRLYEDGQIFEAHLYKCMIVTQAALFLLIYTSCDSDTRSATWTDLCKCMIVTHQRSTDSFMLVCDSYTSSAVWTLEFKRRLHVGIL